MLYDNKERCVVFGEYIVERKATVRCCGAHFGISKSTVHKDVTEKLKKTAPLLWSEVRCVLAQNKAQRHLRGGEATRQKYILKKTLED